MATMSVRPSTQAHRSTLWHSPAADLVPTVVDPGVDIAPEDEATSPDEHRAETLKRRLLRLALDVHDGPMQNLTVIGKSLDGLKARIQALVPPEHNTKIDAGVRQITAE